MSRRHDFAQAHALVVCAHQAGRDLMAQILFGMGFGAVARCASVSAAQEHCAAHLVDLVLCDGELDEVDGYDFVAWLRRAKMEPNSYTPVIMLAAHTPPSKIQKARDCGANFVIAKPIAPSVLLDRIIWIAREARPYIACKTYAGPDRRFNELGPPDTGERRQDLLEAAAADARGESTQEAAA